MITPSGRYDIGVVLIEFTARVGDDTCLWDDHRCCVSA